MQKYFMDFDGRGMIINAFKNKLFPLYSRKEDFEDEDKDGGKDEDEDEFYISEETSRDCFRK